MSTETLKNEIRFRVKYGKSLIVFTKLTVLMSVFQYIINCESIKL